MDIDAHNAQINEINDAKIQQIKAQRKLFGGIIKKGDPLYKNIINVILFALLFPCMIIFELALGIKNLFIYIWESLISLINFIVQTYRRTKQCIIVNYYFVSNWIYNKGSLLIVKLMNGLTICSGYITQKLQQVKLFIIKYSQVFLENFIIIPYKWIAKKLEALISICNFWFQKLSSYIKIQVLKLMRFIIAVYKIILFNVKKIIQIIQKAIKRLAMYLKEKIIQLVLYLQQKIKKLQALFYQHVLVPLMNKITLLCCYLFIQASFWMIRFQKALIYYVPLILDYLEIKYLQVQDWIIVQAKLLKSCIKYLKNRLIHISLLFIDYLLGKYQQLKQNVISPVNLKIKEILKKIKNFIIDVALKTIDFIKLALVFLRDDVIFKLKGKIVSYYRNGSKVSFQVFKILQKRSKMLTLKAKQIYNKMRENSAIRYQKFRFQMQHLQQKTKIIFKIISQITKFIWMKITNITKYIIFKIKMICKFIIRVLKLSGQLIKNFVKLLFRSIKKFIRWTIEFQCKIIVKFIIAFRIFKPIIWLIEKCNDIFFIILSYPYLQFNKIIEVGIDVFIYQIPNKLYDIIVYLIEKFISLLKKIERLLELIFRQAKKIMSIINSKLISPVVRFSISCYKVIKKMILAIVQSLINFKDMIKYNYVLPAWASIRLFGVKLRDSYIKIKQKVIQIIHYGINILKLGCLFLKDQFLFVKNKITNFIKLLIQFIKGQIQLLWQQIKLVYGIIIVPLIQFKNFIIQAFLSFKTMISNYIKLLREIIVAQCILVKQIVQATLNKMNQIFNQIKQSLIEQLQAIKVIIQNIYDSLKQNLIQIKNQIAQQMEQVKQSLIQQKNAIADQFKVIGQNIKMQGILVKESIITLKNDMILTIKTMFKRN